MMKLNRGDIVLINLQDNLQNNKVGVIVSGDDENAILDTVIVIPLSTEIIDDMFPYRMRIDKRDELEVDFDILINQITTLLKSKVQKKIAKLTHEEYQMLIENLYKNF